MDKPIISLIIAILISPHVGGAGHAPETGPGIPKIPHYKKLVELPAATFSEQAVVPVPVEAQTSTQTAVNSSGWHYPPCGTGSNNKQAQIEAAVDSMGLGGSWGAISYIFGHESTYDPGCMNSGGCRGLGQACPGSKLPCGPDDVACQVSYFNNYANGKGGWGASYSLWTSQGWW